jgi:hypothetical protein
MVQPTRKFRIITPKIRLSETLFLQVLLVVVITQFILAGVLVVVLVLVLHKVLSGMLLTTSTRIVPYLYFELSSIPALPVLVYRVVLVHVYYLYFISI